MTYITSMNVYVISFGRHFVRVILNGFLEYFFSPTLFFSLFADGGQTSRGGGKCGRIVEGGKVESS